MATDTGFKDPINFYRADSIFPEVLAEDTKYTGPQIIEDATVLDVHSISLTFDDKTIGIIQFVRPGVFRIRYDPQAEKAEDYPTRNTGNIDDGDMPSLIGNLDKFENIHWDTVLDETTREDGYITFQSRIDKSLNLKEQSFLPYVTLYLYTNPFRIQAVRDLKAIQTSYLVPPLVLEAQKNVLPTVIWQTPGLPLKYSPKDNNHPLVKNVILSVFRPGSAQYLGFGEQGGSQFLKRPTLMNYFCYDNMLYNQVYGKLSGPLDSREPLYHSEPYFLEVSGLPNFQNINATFVDNYSQVVVDLGKNNSDIVRIGTRFGGLDTYHFTADNLAEIIRLYTSIIGRTNLKPRYMLGHHQACYGYPDGVKSLTAVIEQYQASGIPIDGLGIDVDFQDKHRTFTFSKDKFNGQEASTYLTAFRKVGVKCCTNITPIISADGGQNDQEYPTLKSGKEKKVFIPDRRYLQGTTANSWDIRYVYYDVGDVKEIDPNSRPRTQPPDNYDFSQYYNKDQGENNPVYFHGGVWYGGDRGAAGYYPNINLEIVRDWWGEQYKYLFDQGLEFVWQDMTTPAIAAQYGNMKGFPSRLLIPLEGSGTAAKSNWDTENIVLKAAIEQWSLYPLNLHKATFNGLNKLRNKDNRRNFIIGRGSGVGMFRYAALWTGDNGSTWNFWKITVAQVLSLGLGGILGGSDTGGFAKAGSEDYCDPKLLIRWYAGSVGLPWLRNHYSQQDKGKWFQEPYAYRVHINEGNPPQEQKWLYLLVEKICRYYVRLRYSLLQLLYDALFEAQITGLPIARALLITDPLDTSLFNENRDFLDNEYVVRNDLLVAPVVEPENEQGGQRPVYLPYPDRWYSFNLRPLDDVSGQGKLQDFSIPLKGPVQGGSTINYDAAIIGDDSRIPYITPIYVREGAIIPQIPVLLSVPDKDDKAQTPITLHIYPGKNRHGRYVNKTRSHDDGEAYDLYLDDGVSRTSAVNPYALQNLYDIILPPAVREDLGISLDRAEKLSLDDSVNTLNYDNEAKNDYYHIQIAQTTTWENPHDFKRVPATRTITITNLHNGSKSKDLEKKFNLADRFSDTFRVVVWYDIFKSVQEVNKISAIGPDGKNIDPLSYYKDQNAVVISGLKWPTVEYGRVKLELS